MNRLIVKVLCFGCVAAVLGGCQTEKTPSKYSTEVTDSKIEIQRNMIRGRLDEIDMVEKSKENLLHNVSVVRTIPKDVVDRANQARNSVCSDSEYLFAMRAFGQTTSNRLMAVQAELKIYNDWVTADTFSPHATYENTNLTHKP